MGPGFFQILESLLVKKSHFFCHFGVPGDLLAALLLAWLYRHPDDVALAAEKAVAGLQAVLAKTAEAAGDAIKESSRIAPVSDRVLVFQLPLPVLVVLAHEIFWLETASRRAVG